MKKSITVAALALGLVVPVAALATPADANAKQANPRCITKKEFSRIHTGQTPARVRNIVGSPGKISSTYDSDGYRSVTHDFTACKPFNRYSSVSVTYDNLDNQGNREPFSVDSKSSYFLHN